MISPLIRCLVVCAVSSVVCFGCKSATATDVVQAERARFLEFKKEQGYPLKLKETGDATLDAAVGLVIQLANEKIEACEKIMAAGGDVRFTMVNERIDAIFKERGIEEPTLEQRQQMRAEVSKGLSPKDRASLAEACRDYERVASAYRKNEKANSEKFLKASADVTAKIVAISQGGAAGIAAVGISMINGPAGKAEKQLDVATDAVGMADRIISYYEDRSEDFDAVVAEANLSGGK